MKINFSGGFVQKQLVRKSPNEFLSGEGSKTQVPEFVYIAIFGYIRVYKALFGHKYVDPKVLFYDAVL